LGTLTSACSPSSGATRTSSGLSGNSGASTTEPPSASRTEFPSSRLLCSA
jgi:hypothetical protein